MDELDNFLDGEPVEAAEQPEGQPRDEHGRFAAKGVETPDEPKVEAQAEPEATPEPVPPTDGLPPEEFKGLKEERRKRQEAEQRLAALEQQLQSLQQQPPAPPPSIWEDEQGWQSHNRQQILSEADRLSRINASEMAARIKYDDFDEMFARFNQMAALNPGLVQQTLDTTGTPSWLKAYDIARNAARAEELGATNVAELEAKLREQIKAELAAQPPQALPASLAEAQSSRAAAAAPAAPPSLADIIGTGF